MSGNLEFLLILLCLGIWKLRDCYITDFASKFQARLYVSEKTKSEIHKHIMGEG